MVRTRCHKTCFADSCVWVFCFCCLHSFLTLRSLLYFIYFAPISPKPIKLRRLASADSSVTRFALGVTKPVLQTHVCELLLFANPCTLLYRACIIGGWFVSILCIASRFYRILLPLSQYHLSL